MNQEQTEELIKACVDLSHNIDDIDLEDMKEVRFLIEPCKKFKSILVKLKVITN